MELKNKVAFITGAASGMGAATARALVKANMKVGLLDLNGDAVKKIAEEIGSAAVPFQCDVTNEQSVQQAIQEIHSAFQQPIHVGVNCAGILYGKRVVGREGPMPLEDFSRVIQVNLIGTFNVIRLLSHHMSQSEALEENERGVIINTASIAAYEGQIGQAAYSASKAGVVGMTLPIARELSRFGIRMVTIAPGLIETPMLQTATPELQQALEALTVYPKRLGQAKEFASLVSHIIENRLLNGCVIRLDGAVRLTA